MRGLLEDLSSLQPCRHSGPIYQSQCTLKSKLAMDREITFSWI